MRRMEIRKTASSFCTPIEELFSQRLKASITILTGNHLCHNPRVFKEAYALSSVGFDVDVLGAWLDAGLKRRDVEMLKNAPFRFTPVMDATVQKFSWQWDRLRVKAARIRHQGTGKESAWQLGPTVGSLLRVARQRKADLFIAHSEQALWAVSQFIAPRSTLHAPRRVGLDMEDWFSEDLLPEARKGRPVKLLKSLEQGVLSRAAHSTCPSRAMSDALTKEYKCRPPSVIYNAFPWADRAKLDGQSKDRRDHSLPSIHWYSQTLGQGRGLEELIAALPHVQRAAEIHLRGKAASGFQEWLMSSLPEAWRSRVFIHDLVSNDELLSRIAEHDIGFAGEQKYCRSRDLTVTNKILHYLLGGLAVVASDTAGQREIAAQADGAVLLYPYGDFNSLAGRLNHLLTASERLSTAKAGASRTAEQKFCWERTAPRLVESVQTAVHSVKP
jgi:hypothetical protein